MATLPIEGWDALYRTTDKPKNMILSFSDGTTLRNPQIVLEQMSLEESLCSEENLRYGCCESSCFQIRIANNEQSFEGLYLNVVQAFPPQLVRLIGSDDSYIVDDQGDYINGADMYYAKYGNFLVVSDKPTGDRQYRDLTCYDKMYEIIHANVFEWYDGLTFPISVKDFRDSFFEYLNVVQVETDLINDDFEIQGEFYVSEELSGRMVIESICELNGAFGHINRDGLFEYITLPTENSLTYPHYVNGTCAYEDYETEAITGIRAINVEGDSGTVVGTEVNPYIMQSNILTFGSEGSEELMDALNNMLDLVSQFTYTPFKVTTYGNPMLPLGTNVTFETRYKTINSFVMTRFLSGIQALRDTFTTLGDKLYPSDVNRIKSEIQRSAGTTHKLINDVNTLDSEIFDEHGNSRIQQTLDEIVLKVDSNGKLVKVALGNDATLGSTFTIDADYINITSDTIEFDNSGYKVKGDIYTTVIEPDNYRVQANYKDFNDDDFIPEDYTEEQKELIKTIQLNDYSYVQYKVIGEDAQSEDDYNVRLFSYNSQHIISPKFIGHYNDVLWEGNFVASVRESIGEHLIMVASNKQQFIDDGGYIDSDGYLKAGNNHSIREYVISALFSINTYTEILGAKDTVAYGKIKCSEYYRPYGDNIELVDDTDMYVYEISNAYPFYVDYYGGVHAQMGHFYDLQIDDFSDVAYKHTRDGFNAGFIMHGIGTGHTYSCNWTGSQLNFYVDTTNVGYVSDKRLKEDIKEVNPNLVKAICECKTYQYKAFNRGGLISVGIIAQDFVANCEKYGIDPMDYEVCQKSIFKADDDTEYYYIEYSQYLTLKSIHLQNQIDELKELMKK